MENKNNNSGGALITRLIKSIIVIIVMGVFFGLFLYEPRREIKDKNKENDEEIIKTDVEILEVVDDEVVKLYETISYASSYYCGVNIYYTNDKVTSKNIDNKLAFNMALNAMIDDGENSVDNPTNIKAEDMDKKIDSILGKDYEYTHGDYSVCPAYPYNEETKEYEFKGAECGGTCGPGIVKKIVKAERLGDNLDIYVRVLFDKYDDKLSYYSDYDRTKLIDLNRDYYSSPIINDEDYFKGSLYKLRFEKENNNMIFVSSELVKD